MQRDGNPFQYRVWIDGLRAIAVILVILNHFFGLFSAGYTGVDMFFVISGFLVGGIIYEQIAAGTFSLRDFYIKRIHRIVPAQLFMIALVFVALRTLIFPDEIIERFTKEAAAAVISISNYHYWNSIGYFDIESFRKFLLHTWSLAVEEQFYLVLPALLLLLAKFKNKIRTWVLLIFTLSLSANFFPFDGPSKFYLLPFRFWEFLIGFGVYYISSARRTSVKSAGVVAYFAMILLVVLQVNPLHFSEQVLIIATTFVFGFLFWALENLPLSLPGRFFSWPPLRYIGKISYSLYLVHWPVIVFMRLKYNISAPTFQSFIIYISATLLFALISYYLVEKKFRITGERSPNKIKAFSAVFILILMFGTASFITIYKPYSLIGLRVFNQKKIALPDCGQLVVESSIIDPSLPSIVCWGDSHTEMLAFRDNKFAKGYNIYKIYSTGCPPFFNTVVKSECGCNDKQKIQRAWHIIKEIKPAYVVLASRFSIYINGLRINNVLRRGNHFISSDSTKDERSQEERSKAFALGMGSTIDSLKTLRSKIIIIKQVPDFSNFHNPESLVAGGVYSVLPEVLFQSLASSDSAIDKFSTNPSVKIFEPRGYFKGDRGYLIYDKVNNRLLYKDDSHLSPIGALRVTDPLLEMINSWR